jgi:hypothetical protein
METDPFREVDDVTVARPGAKHDVVCVLHSDSEWTELDSDVKSKKLWKYQYLSFTEFYAIT